MVRGPARAFLCDVKDLGRTLPSWQFPRMGDGKIVGMKDPCPEDIKKTSIRPVRDVYEPIGALWE